MTSDPSMQTHVEFVYKIVESQAWQDACSASQYLGSDDDRRDGYIHLSTAEQIRGTLEKHFYKRDGLLIVCFARDALAQDLKWEPSRGGALFPHFYGPLPTAYAVWTAPLSLTEAGHHQLPDQLT